MEPEHFVIKVNHGGIVGDITLPSPDAFTGQMFNTYRDIVERIPATVGGRWWFLVAMAFAEKHGAINLNAMSGEPVTHEVMRTWKPEQEPYRFVAFVGRQFDLYIKDIIDPKK